MNIGTLGETAYEAYRTKAGGRSLATGHPIPDWSQLPEPIKAAWQVAASAVAAGVLEAQAQAAQELRGQILTQSNSI